MCVCVCVCVCDVAGCTYSLAVVSNRRIFERCKHTSVSARTGKRMQRKAVHKRRMSVGFLPVRCAKTSKAIFTN